MNRVQVLATSIGQAEAHTATLWGLMGWGGHGHRENEGVCDDKDAVSFPHTLSPLGACPRP